VKMSELRPGMVLDDGDPATLEVIRDVVKNTRTMQGLGYANLRTVREVQTHRTYSYVTMAGYAVVRRPKDYQVKVKAK